MAVLPPAACDESILSQTNSLIAAETVNGLPGIGGMIREAQRFNQTDIVILGLFVIGLSGLLIDGILQRIDRILAPWRGRT